MEIELLHESLILDSTDSTTIHNLAKSLMDRDDFQTALEVINTGIDISLFPPELLMLKAEALFRTNQIELAMQCYEKAKIIADCPHCTEEFDNYWKEILKKDSI